MGDPYFFSSVVMMELRAGAHSKEALNAVNDMIEFLDVWGGSSQDSKVPKDTT